VVDAILLTEVPRYDPQIPEDLSVYRVVNSCFGRTMIPDVLSGRNVGQKAPRSVPAIGGLS